MGIRQKFFALAGIIGAMVIIISSIGYYTAYTHLNNSIEDAMKGEVAQQSDLIDGWLQVKGRTAVAAANLLQTVDDTTGVRREMMSLMGTDKEIDDLVNGNENGVFMGWKAGEITGQIDPRVRPWYKDAKAAGKLIFTNAYQSATGDKQIVVSAAVPYYDSQGKFRGAICEDILLGTLKDRVAQVKYRGAGEALIIEKATGKVLAASDAKETFTDISSNAVLKDRFAEMAASGQGRFTIEKNGMPEMFVYTTVNSTGWIIGMAVPESVVYAELQAMKMTYGLLTLISIILMVWGCIRFAGSITRPIISLKGHEMQVIKEICDKVAVIENGIIAEEGTVLDVFTKPQQKITKEFISVLSSNELPSAFRQAPVSSVPVPGSHLLVRLTFIGDSADDPVIAGLIRNFKIEVSILFGNLDHIKLTPYGRMIIGITGEQPEIDKALAYLEAKDLRTEVIGYVTRHASVAD